MNEKSREKKYYYMLICIALLTLLLGNFVINNPKVDLETKFEETPSIISEFENTLQKIAEKSEFFNNGQIYSKRLFFENRITVERYWNMSGIETTEIRYLYTEKDRTYDEITYRSGPFSKYIIQKKRYRGLPEDNPVLLRNWFYNLDHNHPLSSEYYREGTNIIDRTDLYNEDGELEKSFIYHYDPYGEAKGRIKGFESYNARGEMIGSYREDSTLDIEEIISKNNSNPKQKENLMRIYRNDKRIPVVIMDTGFDINHNLLTHKIWKNPREVLNGIDDDGNGWVDDIMGWHKYESKLYDIKIDSPNINETFILPLNKIPFSHGSHVASIVFKDLESFAMVGFAGDFLDPDYLRRINRFLKDHNILFANMSFAYKDDEIIYYSETHHQLQKLIADNQQTLFFVAAGNSGLDLSRCPTYPASFPYENILVVGALDTSEIAESELPNYQPSKFSNVGSETVDIFAPGLEIPGASAGGGIALMSGTSMATPYALNCALKVYRENPDLTPSMIKEIIMRSAYVKDADIPLPAVSGGILFPKRAIMIARVLAEDPTLSIEQAALKVRALKTAAHKGEGDVTSYQKFCSFEFPESSYK